MVIRCFDRVLQEKMAYFFLKDAPQVLIIIRQKGLGSFFAPSREFGGTVLFISALHKKFCVGQADGSMAVLQNGQGMQKQLFLIKIGILGSKKQFFFLRAGTFLAVHRKGFAENKQLFGKGKGLADRHLFLPLFALGDNPVHVFDNTLLRILAGRPCFRMSRHFYFQQIRRFYAQADSFVFVKNKPVEDFLPLITKSIFLRFGF